MNINFQGMIPGNFNDDSRVWVYQSSRAFTTQEMPRVAELLKNFTEGWKNHGTLVKGYANLFFEHFIVLIAGETASRVSGFSTDSVIKFIKNIERDFHVKLFDRLMMAFIIQERIQLLPLAEINPSIEKNFITPDTLYFNNAILTKKELANSWIIPVKDSWLALRTLENYETEAES